MYTIFSHVKEKAMTTKRNDDLKLIKQKCTGTCDNNLTVYMHALPLSFNLYRFFSSQFNQNG